MKLKILTYSWNPVVKKINTVINGIKNLLKKIVDSKPRKVGKLRRNIVIMIFI